PQKNHLAARHTREVINPFLKSLRGKVALVMYSLPGDEDPIRKKLYRSFHSQSTDAERRAGAQELKKKLHDFSYTGDALPERLQEFLQRLYVRHVLLVGYATDMCYCRTTAGYENLSKDFNVFLVGDATLATFPANDSPRHATNAHISFASLDHLITQISWIHFGLSKD